MDTVQLDFFADYPNNRPMLLSALGEGIQNACGVYVKNEQQIEAYKRMAPPPAGHNCG